MLNAFAQTPTRPPSRAVNALDMHAQRQGRSLKTSDISKDRNHRIHAPDLDSVFPVVLVITKQVNDVEQTGSAVLGLIQRCNALLVEQKSLFVRPSDCAHSLLGGSHASVESTEPSRLDRKSEESGEAPIWIEKKGDLRLHQSSPGSQLPRLPRFLRLSFLSVLRPFLTRDENCCDTNYPGSRSAKPISAATQILLDLEAPGRVQYESAEYKGEDCAAHREDARSRELPSISPHATPVASLSLRGFCHD